ncbi:EamA/RhaT family transporter [Winogradskyella maritima]|uniref:EamA/RhaT family transporter n=1 Tax=Winogradskyella maritima TaxID=1517766 RepID=A0ABV8ADJ7_9FLAO|nr:EamA/RhaT family transporter [Winogradskyella maritima]
MIYLILSILSSTGIFILFRTLKSFKINTLQVIVMNYITACFTGFLIYDGEISLNAITSSGWFYGAVALGFLFIAIFNVIALTSQRNGLSVASVASKMSVVIPVIFGLYVYKESMGAQKLIGIVLALLAVYLSSLKPKSDAKLGKALLLPILLFFGSGVIDTSIKYLETTYVAENGIPVFSGTIFGFAGFIGIAIIVYKMLFQNMKFELKSIPFGIALGLINYCSIYFLLKALQFEGLESSTIFTVNNVAIVAFSTLVGLVLFKERISKINWMGIGLALVSITLITLA